MRPNISALIVKLSTHKARLKSHYSFSLEKTMTTSVYNHTLTATYFKFELEAASAINDCYNVIENYTDRLCLFA